MTLESISKILASYSDEEVMDILILSLFRLSVREDMCLPIMLMMERKRTRMMQMLSFMGENQPNEHEIVMEAIRLSEG